MFKCQRWKIKGMCLCWFCKLSKKQFGKLSPMKTQREVVIENDNALTTVSFTMKFFTIIFSCTCFILSFSMVFANNGTFAFHRAQLLPFAHPIFHFTSSFDNFAEKFLSFQVQILKILDHFTEGNCFRKTNKENPLFRCR